MNSDPPTKLLEQAEAAEKSRKHLEAVQFYAELLEQTSAKSDDETTREARWTALREKGRIFTLLGEPEAALAAFEQYFAEAGKSRHAVDALVAIGNQCAYMNLTDRAIAAHRDALRLAENLNYTAGKAMAFGGMGLVYGFLDRSADALNYLRKSLQLLEQVGDKNEQARCWNRVGVAHVHLGELDKAIEAFQSAYRIANESDQFEPVALETAIISLNNLGECYQILFDMEQALHHHRQGLVMAEGIELPYLEADLLRNIGFELSLVGQVEEGLIYLQRSLQLSIETNQPDIEVQALYSLALAHFRFGNLKEAEQYAQNLRDLSDINSNQGYLAESLHVLGLLEKERGEVLAAQGLWQEASFLAHETGRRMLLWRLHAALANIAQNPQLASVHNRIAAEIIQQIAQPIEDERLREKFLAAGPVRNVLDKRASSQWGA
jgi:tetratricopeptide (TPR) repeat protein